MRQAIQFHWLLPLIKRMEVGHVSTGTRSLETDFVNEPVQTLEGNQSGFVFDLKLETAN